MNMAAMTQSFLERNVGIELLDAPFDRLGIDGSSHHRGVRGRPCPGTP